MFQQEYLHVYVLLFSDGVVSEGASLGVIFVVLPDYGNHDSIT